MMGWEAERQGSGTYAAKAALHLAATRPHFSHAVRPRIWNASGLRSDTLRTSGRSNTLPMVAPIRATF